jgi:hypothetical protein
MDHDQSRPPPQRTVSDPTHPSRHIVASISFRRNHGALLERRWSERINQRVVLNSNSESGNENTRKPIFDPSSIHLPNLSRLSLKRDAPTDPEKRDFKRLKSTSEVQSIRTENSMQLATTSTAAQAATSTRRKFEPTDPKSEGTAQEWIEPPKKRRKLRRRITLEGVSALPHH